MRRPRASRGAKAVGEASGAVNQAIGEAGSQARAVAGDIQLPEAETREHRQKALLVGGLTTGSQRTGRTGTWATDAMAVATHPDAG
jgi:hypothetical protein